MSRQYSVVPTHEHGDELARQPGAQHLRKQQGEANEAAREEGNGHSAVAVRVDVPGGVDPSSSSSSFILSPPSRVPPPVVAPAHSSSNSPRALDSTSSSLDADESDALVAHHYHYHTHAADRDQHSQQRRPSQSTRLDVDLDADGERSGSDDDDDGDGASSSSSGTTAGLVVLDAAPPGPDEITLTLMRLGGTGLGNVQLIAPLSWTAAQVGARAYEREQREDRMRVRLLFMGRILRDDETLNAAGITSGCVLHAHLTQMAPEGSEGDDGASGSHSSAAEAGAGAGGEVLVEGEGGASSLEGFPGNYSEAQLQQMRMVQLQYEAAALHGGGGGQREGSNGEFLFGFFLGFVLGFLSVIWLYSPSLSRKQRLGILLGLLVNLLMALTNMLDPQRAPLPADGDADQIPSRQPPVVDPAEGAHGIINWR